MNDGEFIARCDAEIQQRLKDGALYWRTDRANAARLAGLAGRMHWFWSYPVASVAIGLATELVRLAEERLLDKVTDRIQNP